jgi:cation diffusion facilitator CzcD-associated flavoprotein CzcO
MVKVPPSPVKPKLIRSSWKWPDIRGLESFKGHLFHTANWEDNYDYKGKRIAVIGNGSSAIQVVPSLQPCKPLPKSSWLRSDVSKLISFNRSPTWITPEFGEDMAPHGDGRQSFYSEDEKERMKDPEYLMKYRKWLEDAMNETYILFRKDAVEQKEAVKAFSVMMANRLKNDERLCRTLIPSFGVGCRRYCPENRR